MATIDLGASYTLADLASRMNNDQLMDVVNELGKQNPLIEIGQFEQANQPTSHKISRQSTLPQGQLVSFNEGVAPEADRVTPVTEEIAMYELSNVVDVRMARLSGNEAKYRAQRLMAAREGLTQHIAEDVFYADKASNEKSFDGLATRLSSLSQTDGAGRPMVYDNGGTGNKLTSIYIVNFGDNRTTMIYPLNHPSAGLSEEDKGEQLWPDQNSNYFAAYVTWLKWYLGMAVYDTRSLKRIANIDTAASTSDGFDPDLLLTALVDMPDNAQGAYILMSRDVYAQMLKTAKDKVNVQHTPDAPFGPATRSDFAGYPIRIFDAIHTDEAKVS